MESRQLVVVGAGVAGISAAIEAAESGVQVALIDENPVPTSLMEMNVPYFFGQRFSDASGEQYGDLDTAATAKLALAQAEDAGVEVQLGTCVWGAFRNSENSRVLDGQQIGLSDYKRSWMLKFERLIVATGSRDLCIGFAGWNIAGAMGSNGARALMSRYHGLTSQRMVILGTGNLGLKTAELALSNGIDVPAIVDVSRVALGDETLIAALKDQGVKLYTSHTIKEAVGTNDEIDSVMLVEIDENNEPIVGSEKVVAADTVCLAVGLVPNVELLGLLDCDLTYRSDLGGFVPVSDEWMRTSVDSIFVAGDAAGFYDAMILNPDIARDQGRLAGIAAAASLGAIDESDADARKSEIEASTINTKPDEMMMHWKRWLQSFENAGGMDILACRCEEVTRDQIIGLEPPRYLDWESEQMTRRNLEAQIKDNPVNPNQVKRLTRAGTGVCQGRHCREQVALLLSEEAAVDIATVPLMTYRPPVRPLPMNVLWPDDETQQVRDEWPKWFSPTNKVLG